MSVRADVARSVALRAASPEDRDFLFSVYASTRQEELSVTGWPAEVIEGFLRSQFDAQDAHYRQHYPAAEYFVIECDREPAGRLYVSRGASDIRIMDIALLPPFRGRGAGSSLIAGLVAEAEDSGRTASIHVEKNNAARHLYDRLGFRLEEDRGVYDLLVWRRSDVS
jgi:ribosomal protein S18 acetylase RimI-like enzyme